ncbi:type II toxin-antitoxin system HicA family toxin [Geodermatophilus chilensis]|uniref:type II toxin-antitoxin system HicA family toxin n=1 Tax=Geodermatophilus chilensis TaxID=2035835 RepID=UPI0018E46E69|nr:type II toxin-antitoxin system HicA family toxin [Geodermatophilus chilensis]
MPKPMKRREVIKHLEAIGATFLREGGEHTVYACPCGQHTTAVPRHREITAGVVGSIQRQIECQPKGWLQ